MNLPVFVIFFYWGISIFFTNAANHFPLRDKKVVLYYIVQFGNILLHSGAVTSLSRQLAAATAENIFNHNNKYSYNNNNNCNVTCN